jgi:serine protease Do
MSHETARPASRAAGARRALALAAALFAAGAVLQAPPAAARAVPDSFADLAEGLLDAVVNISTSQKAPAADKAVPPPKLPEGSPFEEFFDEFFKRGPGGGSRARKQSSLGSGFVIDPAGVIVTNNHVIEGADEITVNFNDGSKLIAELVGVDKKTDMAVLRVKPPKPLKAVTFGDAEALRVGDWVLAIGNPFGLGGSVSAGIVSGRNRDISSGPYDNFLQTDAAINRGNSGGPLFNTAGEVVGINTAIYSPSGGSIGIGFSVPSTTARPVVDQLLQFGETRRGWIGVRIQPVTEDIAESLGIPGRETGALIAGVSDDGPAKKAGLEPGDVVLKFDGREVKDVKALSRIVADTASGREVELVLLRKGKEETRRIAVGRLEESEAKQAALKQPEPAEEPQPGAALGLTLAPISDDLRSKFSLPPDVKGLVITEVAEGSAAEEKKLLAGEVLLRVQQEEVASPDDLTKRLDELRKAGKTTALLEIVNKDGEVRFVAVDVD